jgi:adenylylsulfate kinase
MKGRIKPMTTENIIWHPHPVTKENRSTQKKQRPCILWFTGLSGSGKSTIAGAVEQKLCELGHHTYLLDGDNVRHGLNKDLGFSDDDRVENIRRIGEMSKLFVDAGMIVLTAFISPFRNDRRMVRALVEQHEFIEVHMDTPLATCELRDPKGLYKKARAGEIKNFTGIDSEYEIPEKPEVIVNVQELNIEQCADKVIQYLKANQIIFSQ